jgi:hypothetical protein
MDESLDDAGVNRRAVLRRGAAFCGALVWTVPVVQSVSPSAFAVGSPAVKGVKSGRGVGSEEEAGGLAGTGAFPVAQTLAAGTALVAGGAALTARARRREGPVESGRAADGVAGSQETDGGPPAEDV